MEPLKVGQLAKKVGVTVRTLHHYDQIGLLRPSGYGSTYRLYTQKDMVRLHQILALKSFGLNLKEIEECLEHEETSSMQNLLAMQREAILNKMDALQNTLQSMDILLSRLAQAQDVEITELLNLMKDIKNMEQFYTKEQLETLKKRFEAYPKEVQDVERAWPILFKKFEQLLKKGVAPSDERAQKLAKQAQHFINLFTGGDKKIEENLDKAYAYNQENALQSWGVSKEVFAYAHQARTILNSSK